ncbi:MAG: ABC1 kinase family protein, partial [Nannocystaceae bacterium]
RELFSEFDTTPMASASIGQVHAAQLKSGEDVVLKIQRLDIQPKITSDLHILGVIATWMEDAFEAAHAMDLTGMVRDFAKSLEQELDYRAEASNIEMFRQNFSETPNIHLPKVYRDLSTRHVLCMERIIGKKMTEILEEGGDTNELVTLYFNMAYQMLFVDGFFHGDLHPGNVLIQRDGSLAVIDCGMVGRLAPSRKDRIVDIIWAILNEDLEAVARHIYDLAIPSGVVDYPSFEADAIAIAERYIVGVPLSHIQMGALFSDLVQGATRHQVRMPTDFTMMFKAIMTTEGLAKAIAPDINPIDLAYPYVSRMVTERYSPERIKQVLLSDVQQLSSMLRGMPRALPRTLDNLNRGALTFGLNDTSLGALDRAQSRRTGRTIRAAFTITTLVCGTMALSVEHLSPVLWGINGVSLGFWFLSLIGAFTLLRRGGLL